MTWSLATPPFHVPDEVSHIAYAQYLAETGRLPEANGDLEYAREEENMLAATLFYRVVGDVGGAPAVDRGARTPRWTPCRRPAA